MKAIIKDRMNNSNAKRYLDSVIDKFNSTQDKYKCSFPGEVFNFGWVELQIESDNYYENIRVSLP